MINTKLNIRYSFLIICTLLLMITACGGDKAINKKKVAALQQIGNAYAADGNLRKGLAKLLEAAKLDPDNAGLNHQIAIVLRNLGNTSCPSNTSNAPWPSNPSTLRPKTTSAPFIS